MKRQRIGCSPTTPISNGRLIETFALWSAEWPQDLNLGLRRQQVSDIFDWCHKNTPQNDRGFYQSMVERFERNSVREACEVRWLLPLMEHVRFGNQDTTLLELTAWELTQYLAIYDYLYLSELLSHCSLDNLLSTIASDEATVLSHPDLRAEQVTPYFRRPADNSFSTG